MGQRWEIRQRPLDIEAVFRYAWSSKQVLCKLPLGPKGFNHTELGYSKFYNNQYYAK